MQISNDCPSLESEFTVEQIEKEAYQGRFYSLETYRWESLSGSERFLRNVFGKLGLVDNAFQTCLSRTWKTIDSMKLLPKEIEQRIAELFNESRGNKSLLNAASASIAKIYARVLQANGAEHFEVRQDRNNRLFRVLENGDWTRTIASCCCGVFNFYDKENKKFLTNECNFLFQNDDRLVAKIRIHNHLFEKYKIEILNPRREIIATLSQEGNINNFVLRDQTTHKILALALWNQKPIPHHSYCNYQDWDVTFLEPETLCQKNLTKDILAWALIKHSESYLRSPRQLAYEEDLATNNSMIAGAAGAALL